MLLKTFLISVIFTSTVFAVSLSTSKSSYAQGEQISVQVSGLPSVKDCKEIPDEPKKSASKKKKSQCSWLGLFYAYDNSKAKNLLDFQYTGDAREGTFTFDGLSDNSEYEVRVFYNNNYKEKGFDPFTVVKNENEKVELKTTKESFSVGEVVSVNVSGLPGNSDDWIGIFYAFDESTEENIVYKIETNGAKSGTFALRGLSNEHAYEVRAFFNGSFHEEDYYPFSVVDAGGNTSDVIINEVMASNAHTILDPDLSAFSDWVELYNGGSKSVDLSGFKLSDKVDKATWSIPNGTRIKPKAYMVFWADKENFSALNHHTDFSLKSKGEEVALFDNNGVLIDSVVFDAQTADISCAKENGSIVYMYPTPGAKNSASSAALVLSSAPNFSKVGGFYNGSQSLILSASNGAKIYYTIDGSYPTSDSKVYNGAISIDKTTTVRAMSVEDGKFPSAHKTHTYFIDESSTLPVVSITTDEKYLWDEMIGIYTVGINGAPMLCSDGNANFMQDWARPAFIEYFDKDKNLGFGQEIKLKVSGTCSRELAQKSLSIKADDKYEGKKVIAYKIFKNKDISEFKSIKLRNSGQDWWKTMIRDAMMQQLIKDDMDVDYQAYQPSIVFINGEYWGIHNIREKKNEDYLAANHPGLDPDKVDILYADMEVKEGKPDDYSTLISYIQTHPLSVQENYDYVASQVDIENYIDYEIAQIYFGNSDWPGNNIRYYKEQKEGAKWRWMMDDQDEGFDLYSEDPNAFGLYHNTLAHATAENSNNWRNAPWSTFLLRSLLENETFKDRFVAKFTTYLNSTFAPARVKTLINGMTEGIKAEMPRHIATWGDAGPDYANMTQWYDNISILTNFADKRADIVKGHLAEKF